MVNSIYIAAIFREIILNHIWQKLLNSFQETALALLSSQYQQAKQTN